MEWVSVKERKPDKREPIVYARPNRFEPGKYHVGIAYWTVSDKWQPEAESQQNPQGFSHWISLPPRPDREPAGPGTLVRLTIRGDRALRSSDPISVSRWIDGDFRRIGDTSFDEIARGIDAGFPPVACLPDLPTWADVCAAMDVAGT